VSAYRNSCEEVVHALHGFKFVKVKSSMTSVREENSYLTHTILIDVNRGSFFIF